MADSQPRPAYAIGFRGRLIAAFIALLAGVLVSIRAIVNITADRSVRTQSSDRLRLSERVWDRLLEANADRLLESVSLLAKDFAFREAVATGDEPTAQSALLNHGQRIHSDLALLLQSDGSLRSSLEPLASATVREAFAPLLAQAEMRGQASDVVVIEG